MLKSEQLAEKISKGEERLQKQREELAELRRQAKKAKKKEEADRAKRLDNLLQKVSIKLKPPLLDVLGPALYDMSEDDLLSFLQRAIGSVTIRTDLSGEE